MVKNPPSNREDVASTPVGEQIPHDTGQLSLHAAMKDLIC